MRSLHFAFPLMPLAAALILGACGAPGGPVTPAASAPAGGAAATPAASPSAAAGNQTSKPPSVAPTPGGTVVPFEKLSYDGPSEEGKPLPVTDNRRLKTQAELDALLDRIGALKANRPTVDFSKKEVLAFYDEGGNNGCYELQLLELLNRGAVLTPKFADKPKPGVDDGRICTMVLVLPHYLLVAIDRTPLPVAGIDAPGASPAPSPMPSGGIAFRDVETGSYSGIDVETKEVIRTAAAWKAFYAKHKPDQAAPAVDFGKEMVLAVVAGERNSGGYVVGFDSVVDGGARIKATWREKAPTEGATMAITQPHSFVAVPKSDDPVDFEKAK